MACKRTGLGLSGRPWTGIKLDLNLLYRDELWFKVVEKKGLFTIYTAIISNDCVTRDINGLWQLWLVWALRIRYSVKKPDPVQVVW